MSDVNESHLQAAVWTRRHGPNLYSSDAYVHAHHFSPQVQAEMYHAGAVAVGGMADAHSRAMEGEARGRRALGVYCEQERRRLKEW